MIGLGSQYLTAAGFGRYRITAASLGNLDLLGTYWLNLATLRAILAAFGDDGWAVIKATNAYLNQLAAQGAAGKDKATALAGWLNTYAIEDARIVYSLIPTLGVRWTGSTGTQYINLGYYPLLATNDLSVRIKFRLTANNSDTNILGSYNPSAGRSYPLSMLNNKPFYGIYGYNVGINATPSVSLNEWHEAYVEYLHSQGKQRMVIDGTEILTSSYAQNSDVPVEWYAFTRNMNGSAGYSAIVDIADIQINEVNRRDFKLVPFIHNDNGTKKNGLLDMVGGQFYPNLGSGSFTISETPSTP